MSSKKRTFLFIISAAFFICLSVFLLPPVRNYIVQMAENYKGESINEAFWSKQIFGFASFFMLLILCIDLSIFTKKGSVITNDISTQIRTVAIDLFKKENIKYFLIIFALYLFSLFTLFRSNFYYISVDDLGRILVGDRNWKGWYRYVSEFGSIIIHTNSHIIDIAPLTQILAALILSVSSYIIIYCFNNKKFTVASCIAVLPLGLSPYFLTNISYRFDSPYMALSILFSLVPFLFIDSLPAYIFTTAAGLFLMCFSYQASSSIYIITTLLLALLIWNKGKRKFSECMKYIGISAACYLIVLGLFKCMFIERPTTDNYVDINVSPLAFFPNTIEYIKIICSDFGKTALSAFALLIIICFTITQVKSSTRNKFLSAFLTILTLCISFIFTYGVYLFLSRPEWEPRSLIGIGIFFSVLSVSLVSNIPQKKCFSSFVLYGICFYFSWCLIAFSFAYGNAQDAEKQYTTLRAQILIEDLEKYVSKDAESVDIEFKGSSGHAPAVESMAEVYPVVTKLVSRNLNDTLSCKWVLSSCHFGTLTNDSIKAKSLNDVDLPVLSDSVYETIQGDGSNFIVTLKTPTFALPR